MDTRTLEWNWRGKTIRLGADASGTGPTVLLLPALSSISSRREMHPLQERLAPRYSTLSVDWPGFGDAARPQVDWTPDAYAAFLAFLLASVIERPYAIIAAGHAATYVLKHAAAAPATTRLVLIAPTWRGPLPTMMGGDRPFFDRLCRLVDRPGLGPLIYRLNVNRFVVRHMGAGHVYADGAFLSGERLRQKLNVVRAPGARFASVRFVTGRLDPLASRDAFLDLARRAAVPILLVYGAETPPRSRAEMEALAAVGSIRTARLPKGKLAVHEEFPDATIDAIDP
ncbi:MAG TPA: alpha/beta hydrolase, partial [Xanthobacteraceae bacterium]|nr:alpha/beta hydrolase [Xanthobacteraceae bacterium]